MITAKLMKGIEMFNFLKKSKGKKTEEKHYVLPKGERTAEVTHKGEIFKFIFPEDVTHVTFLFEEYRGKACVVAACMYGIIYPIGTKP